jgi:mannosyltransferase OCH1-like enzyme
VYNETALYHQNMEKIPHIIHYCWFGRNPKSELVLNCIESWKKYLPGYEIREWNEDNYDVTQVNFVKEAYENQKWAFVSDYVRFDVLYQFGGIYFDTDVELLKPIPEEILAKRAFTGFESTKLISPGWDRSKD